jgi:hypothetical protein
LKVERVLTYAAGLAASIRKHKPVRGKTMMGKVGQRFVVLVAAFAAALVAVAYVAESSPASRELAVEASAQGTKFVSKKYGYEIAPVGDWDGFDAYDAWTGNFPFGSSGEVDQIIGPGDRKFIVGAKRVLAGTTLRKWEASQIANMQSFCKKARAFRNTTLGGVAAREFSLVCPSYDVITVVALHRGRGYLVNFLSPSANATASDRRIYDAGRRSFRFTQQ